MNTAQTRPTRPLWQRMLMSAGRTALTLTIIGGAIGAGVAGHNALSVRASEVAKPDPAPRSLVAPEVLRMQDQVTLTRRFTGQFEAAQEVSLAFEEGGTEGDVPGRRSH